MELINISPSEKGREDKGGGRYRCPAIDLYVVNDNIGQFAMVHHLGTLFLYARSRSGAKAHSIRNEAAVAAIHNPKSTTVTTDMKFAWELYFLLMTASSLIQNSIRSTTVLG